MTNHTEEHRVSGEGLVAKVKELLHEGNVRRIIVKNEVGGRCWRFPWPLV